MKKSYIIIPVIAAIVIGSVALTMGMDSGDDFMDPAPVDTGMQSGIDGTVNIGILLPLTGDLASHGEEDRMAAELAIDDFNMYLAEKGSTWNVAGLVEDSQTNPVISLEKLTALNARDVNVVVGPAASANIRNTIGYVTANDMILISCCSTAPSLAIEGDNVFRVVPDDNNQGPKIADLMLSNGIEVMVPVWRADAWGDGLQEASANAFMAAGGLVDEGIRYNPEAPEFSASASLLADTVQNYVDQYGEDKVAVLMISFAESLQLIQSAVNHDVLGDVRWFGSDASTNEQRLVTDPIGLDFSQKVQFTTVQFGPADNPTKTHVKEYIESEIGRVPSVYAYTSYDAVWLAGLAIEAAQSTETASIRDNIIPVSMGYNGAVGSTALNAAGDLDSKEYATWTIRDGEWLIIDQ